MKKLLASIALLLSFSVQAETYTVVSSLPAGTGPDVVLRKITQHLEDRWNKDIVVVNKPGANGLIAAEHFYATADENTLYYGDMSNFTSMPLLFDKQEIVDNLDPVASVYDNFSWVIVTAADKTNEQLIEDIKNRGSFGSWGVGSAGHLAGLEVVDYFGVDAVHVPYKNFGQWFTDIANDDLAFSVISFGSTKGMVQSGKLRWVAVTGTESNPYFNDIGTIKQEFGIEEFFNRRGWLAFYSKSGTVSNLDNLQDDVAWAVAQPDVAATLESIYAKPWNAGPAGVAETQASDYENYVELFDKFSISVEK